MKDLSYFILYLIVAFVGIVCFGVILGDYAPWYLAWSFGTGLIVLVSAGAGALYDAQEEARRNGGAAHGGH
ncbi:hypothetical protein [Thiomonas sp.]